MSASLDAALHLSLAPEVKLASMVDALAGLTSGPCASSVGLAIKSSGVPVLVCENCAQVRVGVRVHEPGERAVCPSCAVFPSLRASTLEGFQEGVGKREPWRRLLPKTRAFWEQLEVARRLDDATSSVVGVVLMVGAVVGMAAVAVLFMPASPFVDSVQVHDARAVSYCEGHPFELPACDHGRPIDATGAGLWCSPLFPGLPDSPVKCIEVSAAVLVRCVAGVDC